MAMYPKVNGESSKVIGPRAKMEMTMGGPVQTGSGPTGSSRMYSKSGPTSPLPGNTDSAPFNPQRVAATKIYVGGVGE